MTTITVILTGMLAMSSSGGCLNGWTMTTSSWWRRSGAVHCITKHRAVLHSAMLTAQTSDQWTTSRWYGDCSCYADCWNTRSISSVGVANRSILTGHVAITATAVITVTYCDKVHGSAAVRRQWQLIQQASEWCPMSINLSWMLPYRKHAVTSQSIKLYSSV